MTTQSVISGFDLTDKEFEKISSKIMDLCGINLHTGKRELVKARLSKRLRKLGLGSYEAYMRYVEQDPSGAELANMIDALSTNVTQFFRESQHMDHLRDDLLPKLTADQRGSGQPKLRIWSAGCSSGEEPYTIAMVLREALRDIDRWDIKLLATDISNNVLAKAREGIYEESKLRDVPAALRGKYFGLVDSGPPKRFQTSTALRSMVHFARLNLLEPWPMKGPFDFIFCRNVMIYFDQATRQQLITRFAELLAPGGALFIGHSESLSGIRHKLRQMYPTVYQN